MPSRMTPSGFHHVAVQVRDVERVAAFYARVLGLTELRRFLREDGALRSVWLSVGGAGGFLAVESLPEAPVGAEVGFSMVALRIDAAARGLVLEELARAGVPVVKQTAWTLYVKDPEGNLVGLSHHPDDAEVGAGAPDATAG